jgi:hypothetical protein
VCVRFAATDASIITLHNDTHNATSIKTCRALKSHTSSAGIEFRTTHPAVPHCYSHTLVLSLQPIPLYLLSHIFCNSTLKAMAGLIYSPLRTVLWTQDFSLHSFKQLHIHPHWRSTGTSLWCIPRCSETDSTTDCSHKKFACYLNSQLASRFFNRVQLPDLPTQWKLSKYTYLQLMTRRGRENLKRKRAWKIKRQMSSHKNMLLFKPCDTIWLIYVHFWVYIPTYQSLPHNTR